jgi:predicted ester cyclase
METTDRVSLYCQVIAAISRGDSRALDDILAPDIVDHNPIPGQSPGCEGFEEWMAAARSSFPDLCGTVEHFLVSGDFVIGRVIWRGTQRGTLAGLPPTQRSAAFEAIHIVRFEGPSIVEWWGVADLLGAINQLGGKVLLEESEKGSFVLGDDADTIT